MGHLKAEQLLAFCLAAKFGSISAAAKQLDLSQPAVSGQLNSLQKQVNQTLYQRVSHGIELTPAGQVILPYACAVARTLAQAQSYVRGENETGVIQLQIGLSHHLVPIFTGQLLKATRSYHKQHGDLDLHLREAYSQRLIQLVKSRDLDAAFIVTQARSSVAPLVLEPLRTESIVLLVKPDDPVAKENQADIRILNNETLIVSSSQSQVYRRVQHYLEEANVQPARLLEVSGPDAVKNAVLDDLGIGISLESYATREVQASWLKTVALNNKNFSVDVALVSHDLSSLDPQRRKALEAVLNFQER